MTITQIEEANRRAGFNFFESETMRFFKCRIHQRVYSHGFFVSSEKGPDDIRRYTIRRANQNGSIETIGGFQHFSESATAHHVAKCLAAKFTFSITTL